jgi:hypothetical protein
LGRACHLNHYFNEASIYYESYRNILRFGRGAKDEIPEVDRLIQMCRNGSRLVYEPVNTRIQNLGPQINSSFEDFAPVITEDEQTVFFTSRRGDPIREPYDPLTGQFYENIYQARKVDGNWQKPVRLDQLVNREEHNATVGISPDGNLLLIYRGNNNSLISKVSGDLYQSEVIDGRWGKPEPWPGKINTRGWEPSGSLTQDGKTLYFCSDRPGGEGGRDLYLSRKLENGNWSEPENLGILLNTAYDEDAPFIHPDGNRLYFSSTGHNSIGGFDIFVTDWNAEKKRWEKPRNMGYPINTADDDIYFVWSKDGKRGYFSSTRSEGFGEADIYLMYRDEEDQTMITLKGHVFNKINKKPTGAAIMVRNPENQELIEAFEAYDRSGSFNFSLPAGKNYTLSFMADGYQPETIALELEDHGVFETNERSIYLEPKF